MGKENDLWDDSALINAFNQAVTKYKEMHSGTYQGSSEGERHMKGNNENDYAIAKETGVHRGSYIDSNDVAKAITETCMPCYSAEVADDKLPIPQYAEPIENHGACPPASFSQFSGAPSTHEKEVYSDSQGVEYNQLLNKYYELEDQKQKVLQQLQESNWNYQSPGQFSTSHAYQGSDYVSSHPGVLPSCYPCPCGGCSYCSSCNTCWSLSQAHQIPAAGQHATESCSHFMPMMCKIDPMKQAINADDSTVKTAMEAAERAISAMKLEASATPGTCKENEKGKVETSGIQECQGSENICSETDLTAVLSAWYSAGFHTGRYLLQQSSKKNQH